MPLLNIFGLNQTFPICVVGMYRLTSSQLKIDSNVMNQNGWDAKRIAIQLGVGVYLNVCLRENDCL